MKLELAVVIKNIKYQAYRLKLFPCFADETHEDLEQELFCQIWLYLDKYDESRGSFNTFVARLAEHRANNLLRKQLCTISSYADIEAVELFEDDITKQTDVDYMISTLPKKWQNICEQLKYFNRSEVAKINGISRNTLSRIIRKIRAKLHPIYYKDIKKN